jgi:HTH-type transcriptional regulator / antitoxin HipB
LFYTKISIKCTYTKKRIVRIVMIIDNIKTAKLLGVAIKRMRKQKGLSQNELALKMNMRQATISAIENGKGTIESLFKVIQILQVNFSLSDQTSLQSKKINSKNKKILDLLED